MAKSKVAFLTYYINEETGEILGEFHGTTSQHQKVVRKQVDYMLSLSKTSEDIDLDLLYHWCRIIKAINGYNQIQHIGNKLNDKIEDELLEEGVVCAYVLKAIKLANKFTHILMNDSVRQIQTWTELWEVIGCKNSDMQKKVKTFLEKNKLIKCVPIKVENKNAKKNLFVLNPYLYKNSSHVGQFACVVWQECAIPNVNINFYAYMYLVGQGTILFNDKKEYEKLIKKFVNIS